MRAGTPPSTPLAIIAIEIKGTAGIASIGGTGGTRPLSADASPWLQWAAQTGCSGEGILASQSCSMAATSARVACDSIIKQPACAASANCDQSSATIATSAIRARQRGRRERSMDPTLHL